MSYCKSCKGTNQATVVYDESLNIHEQLPFPVVAIDCPCGYQYVKKGYNIVLSDKQPTLGLSPT